MTNIDDKWGVKDITRVFTNFRRFKHNCLKLMLADNPLLIYGYQGEHYKFIFYKHMESGWTWFIVVDDYKEDVLKDIYSKLNAIESICLESNLAFALPVGFPDYKHTLFLQDKRITHETKFYTMQGSRLLVGPFNKPFYIFSRKRTLVLGKKLSSGILSFYRNK